MGDRAGGSGSAQDENQGVPGSTRGGGRTSRQPSPASPETSERGANGAPLVYQPPGDSGVSVGSAVYGQGGPTCSREGKATRGPTGGDDVLRGQPLTESPVAPVAPRSVNALLQAAIVYAPVGPTGTLEGGRG